MDRQRRRFLQAGAAVAAGAGSAVLSGPSSAHPRVEWSRPAASPWDRVWARVFRGSLPEATRGILAVYRDDSRRTELIASQTIRLDEPRLALPFELEYPYDELRDIELRYTLSLRPRGGAEVISAPLLVQVFRYRFGS